MAHHSSAKKAIRHTVKRTLINKSRDTRIKTYIKKVLEAISAGSKETASIAFVKAQSEIMRGVTKGVLKMGTASRTVSRLNKRLKSL